MFKYSGPANLVAAVRGQRSSRIHLSDLIPYQNDRKGFTAIVGEVEIASMIIQFMHGYAYG
jgi:hypothetical protein